MHKRPVLTSCHLKDLADFRLFHPQPTSTTIHGSITTMAFKGFQTRTQDENRKPPTAGASVKDPPAKHTWPTPQPSTFHRSSKAPSNTSTYTTASKEAPSTNPQSAHFSKRYPCSFKGCGRRFDEKASLFKHKDSEHDYCLPCDIDFDDDEALHVHKMQSSMHIICPICGIDFKSEPGRDRHARQVSEDLTGPKCLHLLTRIRCTPHNRTSNAAAATRSLRRGLPYFCTSKRTNAPRSRPTTTPTSTCTRRICSRLSAH